MQTTNIPQSALIRKVETNANIYDLHCWTGCFANVRQLALLLGVLASQASVSLNILDMLDKKNPQIALFSIKYLKVRSTEKCKNE